MRGTVPPASRAHVSRSQSTTGAASGQSKKACESVSSGLVLARQHGAWHCAAARGTSWFLSLDLTCDRKALHPRQPCRMRQQVMRKGLWRIGSQSRGHTWSKPSWRTATGTTATSRAAWRSAVLGRGAARSPGGRSQAGMTLMAPVCPSCCMASADRRHRAHTKRKA